MTRRRTLLLTLLLVLSSVTAGCLAGLPGGSTDAPTPGADGSGPEPGADDGNRSARTMPALRFDGQRALGHVEDQVRWPNGTTQYRVPGTPGRAQAADEIATVLEDLGWQVRRQVWSGTYRCDQVELENVEATLPGRSDDLLLLGAHYDTRPWADKDPDSGNWDEPVPGANDGGSGVGVLLELARVLSEGPELNHTVRLLFFDAEDGGHPPQGAACQENDWIIGSTHYAETMPTSEVERTRAFLLVDLVGDANLTLMREGYSANGQHRALQDRVWSTAANLGHEQFRDTVSIPVTDDHRPFQQRGIQAVDLIHLDCVPRQGNYCDPFPATHHRVNDDLAHVSAASLEAVGRVVEHVVYDLDGFSAS